MPSKKSYLTITDQFCGAGGSSQGARRLAIKWGGGLVIVLAINHWKRAVETHNANFPDTLHIQTDVSTAKVNTFPSTDILITSPECTWQGYARNKKLDAIKKQQTHLFNEDAELRSRATMWDVPRFAEYHKYNLIIVENVTGAYKWINFPDWLAAMDRQGYDYKINFLNSMFFYPTPQSRDRMYVVFWKKGNKAPDLDFRPKAYCAHCEKDIFAVQVFKKQDFIWGTYKRQYYYICPDCSTNIEPYRYGAFNIINWKNLGKQIGDRLAPATRKRIQTGLDKFGDSPFMLKVNRSLKAYSMLEPLYTIAAGGRHHGFVTPFIVENKKSSTARSTTEPLSCVTTVQYHGLVTDEAWRSFINYYYRTPQFTNFIEPVNTFTAKDRMSIVNFQKPRIEDCYYRMLHVPEIQKGMAFEEDYILLGSHDEKVRQLGNAVTPPVMEWLLERGIESLN